MNTDENTTMIKALRFAFGSDPTDFASIGQIFYSFLRQSSEGDVKRGESFSCSCLLSTRGVVEASNLVGNLSEMRTDSTGLMIG